MNKKGFTLIELLVSMGIMGIMTTMAIVNFRSAEYSDELRYAALNLGAEIRRAQTFSLINKPTLHCRGDQTAPSNGSFCPSGDDSDCDAAKCVLDAPKGGYGIRIDTMGNGRSTLFFADTGNTDKDGNSDHVYQDYELMRRLDFVTGQNVTVDSVSPNGNGVLDISFMPPRPKAWFNGDDTTPIATITLIHNRSGNTRTVKINGISGQISIE